MILIVIILLKWGIIRITTIYYCSRARLATRIMPDRDDFVQLFFMLLSNITTIVLQVRIHRNVLL
jgi:hypothetical protein